ncbi:hypothetical protein RSSM_03630 [Rhodopirellula sallentina SM41]|uniref:Uncharacterized protein n=1 Tax=Rhodopirellula sallentina SM41 TaxID=1263870 RepID=M5UAQ7_9BACT|nr:hypothetical protein RSSM_03630 [Rhodopirellula sallentina SM41]
MEHHSEKQNSGTHGLVSRWDSAGRIHRSSATDQKIEESRSAERRL